MSEDEFEKNRANENEPDELDKREQALLYFYEGEKHQMRGEFGRAIELYMKSINLYPSAKVHTWLGWTYSMMGRVQDAIEECHKAIRLDRNFGNPYNDIGACLVQLGEHDAAIPWLEKAIDAPDYEARSHPHMNLGRIWEHRLEWEKAIESYRNALYESPDYEGAFLALKQLRARLN